MMRFMRFHSHGSTLVQASACAAAIVIAALGGGCSATLSGPSFGYAEESNRPQQTASGYGRSNLGNDSYGGGGAPYSQPRTYRESSVASQNLPDASPSSTAYSGGRTGTNTASNSRYDTASYNGNASNYGSSSASSGSSPSSASSSSSNTPSSYGNGSSKQANSNYNSYTANGRYGTVAPASTASTNRYDPQPTPSLANPGDTIEVQSGDTLYNISRRHNVSVAELMQLNNMTSPSLKLGQKLYLPQGVSAQQAPSRPITQTASIQPPPPPANLESKYSGTHTVRAGESIYAISRSYGVSAAELQQANGITDTRTVKAGAVLRVPGSGGSTAMAGNYGSAPSNNQPLQQVAVAPPASNNAQPVGYDSNSNAGSNSGSPSSQPTMLNGMQPSASPAPNGGSNYTQVATRNVNDVATAGMAPAQSQPARQSVAASGSDKLRWPVSGRIISGFGQRSDGTHNDGINMSVPMGTQVHAAEGGTVAYAGSELKGYGNLILLRHDNGWVTAYAHNDQLQVKRGDKVQRGQVIATAGRSGSVDQPQVHFELRQGSKPVDPVPFLERL
jgi:murein DD-endopeptidase MepM/ murein hydrolase activator NlpD